jgi:TonB family protein
MFMASTDTSLNRVAGDLASRLTEIAERAVRMTASSGAMIALRQSGGLITAASSGECVPPVGTTVRATSFAGRSVAEETLLICPDTENDPRVDAAVCRALNVRSMLAAPILCDGAVAGVLAVFGSRPGGLVEDSAGLVRTLATIAGELLRTLEPVSSALPPETPAPANSSSTAPEAPAVPVTPSASEPAPEESVIRTLPYFDELQAVKPAVVEAEKELPAPNAVISEAGVQTVTPAVEVVPDITTVPLHPEVKEDPDDLLLPSFTLQEPPVRRRTGLKLIIVLLVVAVLAAGQWMLRGKIIKAIRSHLSPAPATVQPTAPTPVPPPVVTPPAPAAVPSTVTPETPAPKSESNPTERSIPAAGDTRKTSKPAGNTNVGKDAAYASPAEIRPPQLLSRVEPVSPPGLKAEAIVALNATILSDGSIGKVTVVSGEAALRQAAIAAVKRWKYRPAYQRGQPVAVTVPIEVTFQAR